MQVEKRYIIRAGNQFVGVHLNGMFFYTSFWDCKAFHELKEAQRFLALDWGKYKDIEWEIYATDEVGLKFVQAEPDPYEIELAALKKKHNRT